MAVLKSRLVNVNPGDTPAVLGVYIEKNIKPGSFKNSLIWLQKKLDAYDRDIQSGDPSNLQNGNLVMEIREIKHQVRRLKRRWRLLDGLKKVAGKFGFKRR